MVAAPSTPSGSASGLATDAFAVVCVVAAARFADLILLARDDVLSENALRALEIGEKLRSGALARHTFRFSTSPEALASENAGVFGSLARDTVPLLTLRSPLAAGEVRRVNLFEVNLQLYHLSRLPSVRHQIYSGRELYN